MFERRHELVAPLSKFFIRLILNILLALTLIAAALFAGMSGYHHFEHMSWIDSFANAAMILSGMGPLGNLSTDGGKLFAGFYALFSGLAFILIISIIFAPIVHRYFHKFHVESDTDYKSKSKRNEVL